MVRKAIFFSLIFLSYFFCVEVAAQAADVTIDQGQVLIGRGTGYAPIDTSSGLIAGDVVVAKSGATAHVTFSDGCDVVLEPGAILRVGLTSPCKLPGSQLARVPEFPLTKTQAPTENIPSWREQERFESSPGDAGAARSASP